MNAEPPFAGTIVPGFEPVQALFAENFRRDDAYRELGAALCVCRGAEVLVDLWGGWADKARTRPWQADTLVNVYSTTKAMTALCLAMLVDRTLIRYEDPVGSVWPEFAAAGKETARIFHLACHEVGLPGFSMPTTVEDLFDWQRVTARLAAQAPMWQPGEKASYHAMTMGFLVGEVVRRVSGRSLGRFLAEEVAGPLGADFHIGLPASLDARVAEMVGPRQTVDLAQLALPSEALAALVNPVLDPTVPNRPEWRRAEIPAANGQASARGAARIFAVLAAGGSLGRERLLSPEGLARFTAPRGGHVDLLLGAAPPWASGVGLNGLGLFGPNPRAYGHTGWGGSFVCADPDAGIAIAYVCNQMGQELIGDPRGRALAAEIHRCLDLRANP